MTITLDIPAEQIAALRDGLARRDAEAIGRALLEGSIPTIPEVTEGNGSFDETQPSMTMEEYDRWLDELDAFMNSVIGPDVSPLSDYAISREGIYGDHP